MTTDALDPGPEGNYPYAPRNPDGTLDTTRMPIGLRHQVDTKGKRHLIDVEHTGEDGRRMSEIIPLTIEED